MPPQQNGKKRVLLLGFNIPSFPKTCILILNFDPETVYNRGTNLMLFSCFLLWKVEKQVVKSHFRLGGRRPKH